jgi:hypothetical protein
VQLQAGVLSNLEKCVVEYVWRTRHAVITHSGDDRNPCKAIGRRLSLDRNNHPQSEADWRVL